MWKATIRGLVARKVRLVLTALAILLGVSFVSATYVLTDTVKRSFDAVFSQTLSGVDLQVQGHSSLGDLSNPGRISDSTVERVRGGPRGGPGRAVRADHAGAVRRPRRRNHRRRRATDLRDLVGRR